MLFFSIDVCPSKDPSFAFMDEAPVGTEMDSYRMSKGLPMGDRFPKKAKVYLQKKSPGTKLPSLIGNTYSFLVVNRPVMEVLRATGVPMECLGFTLHDQKKRPLSADYFIVNPLGTFDALHEKKSKVAYEGDDVVGIDKLVLDARKLAEAPDLFRLKEDPYRYVVSHRLADKLKALKPTNVYLEQLEQA
jgi:hypothetical protein